MPAEQWPLVQSLANEGPPVATGGFVQRIMFGELPYAPPQQIVERLDDLQTGFARIYFQANHARVGTYIRVKRGWPPRFDVLQHFKLGGSP